MFQGSVPSILIVLSVSNRWCPACSHHATSGSKDWRQGSSPQQALAACNRAQAPPAPCKWPSRCTNLGTLSTLSAAAAATGSSAGCKSAVPPDVQWQHSQQPANRPKACQAAAAAAVPDIPWTQTAAAAAAASVSTWQYISAAGASAAGASAADDSAAGASAAVGLESRAPGHDESTAGVGHGRAAANSPRSIWCVCFAHAVMLHWQAITSHSCRQHCGPFGSSKGLSSSHSLLLQPYMSLSAVKCAAA